MDALEQMTWWCSKPDITWDPLEFLEWYDCFFDDDAEGEEGLDTQLKRLRIRAWLR
jgi:hypothetical protein